MNGTSLFRSSVGKKFIMAGTGLLLFGFVLAHLVGNLQVFLAPEVINRYGNFLQSNLELIWPARIGLLAIVFLHIWAAVTLSAQNKAARPIAYAQTEVVAATYASRTMLMSGLIIAAFIIYHLLHFTVQLQALNLVGKNFADLKDAKGQHDVFAMLVIGFKNPIVAGFYIFSMFLLFLHLSHGLSAMFQSLGFKNREWACTIKAFAKVTSWIIFAGYISIPIAVQLGYGSAYVNELLMKGVAK